MTTINNAVNQPTIQTAQPKKEAQPKETKKGISTTTKVVVGTGLAALAAVGMYMLTKGKTKVNPNNIKPELKELTAQAFKEAGNKFEKGKAILKNGEAFTGSVVNNCKDGSKVTMEYANGILQKSTKIKGENKIFEKVYTYGTDGKISKINKDLGDVLLNPFEKSIDLEKGVIIRRSGKNILVQDIDTKKVLKNKGKDFYYGKDGNLKYTRDNNKLITAYHPDGKTKRFVQDEYGVKFFDTKGEEVAYFQADFARGKKDYIVKYPNRKVAYQKSNFQMGNEQIVKENNMKFYSKDGESLVDLVSWSDGSKFASFRSKRGEPGLRLELNKDGMVDIIRNNKSLGSYNTKTKELISNDNTLTQDSFSKIIEEVINTANSVKQEHKQALRLRNEYSTVNKTISKQFNKNVRDTHFID